MIPVYSSVCATSPKKGVLVSPRYFSSRSTHVKKMSLIQSRLGVFQLAESVLQLAVDSL